MVQILCIHARDEIGQDSHNPTGEVQSKSMSVDRSLIDPVDPSFLLKVYVQCSINLITNCGLHLLSIELVKFHLIKTVFE